MFLSGQYDDQRERVCPIPVTSVMFWHLKLGLTFTVVPVYSFLHKDTLRFLTLKEVENIFWCFWTPKFCFKAFGYFSTVPL